LQGLCNDFQHAIHVCQDFIVPKAHNTIIVLMQPVVSQSIRGAVQVLPAIEFYNQAPLSTYEIDNIAADRLLANKLAPANPA
jgi:hypothetical protein